MDDGDDAQLIIPDSKGKLDLTNRAWITIDPLVWTFYASLVILGKLLAVPTDILLLLL